MMKQEYALFDEYLKKSKSIRNFCDDREKMMFEVLRMDLSEEGKIHWLNSIGYEIDKLLSLLNIMENERKSYLNLKQ